MTKNHVKLSKIVAHALRHEPWLYELELDNEGWVTIEDLLIALRANDECHNLTKQELEEMVLNSDKKRYEISGSKIRAFYGHSIENKLIKEKSNPPHILYHGTTPELLETIFNEGLKPMNRHYVHLSADIEIAKQVGLRKSKKPTILMIDAEKAYLDGVGFYCGNDKIWLADDIPPYYITQLNKL